MDIVNPDAMQWHMPRSGHREDGVEFKTLFQGEDGQPVNYWFTLVRVREGYHTPPHRHVFDQVRVMLKGSFNFGEQDQPEGTIGYFTEGTFYEQKCDNYSFHLLLQIEGPSGQPYLPTGTMRAATEALKARGEFRSGLYVPASGGEPIDGFEAIYTEATGRSLVYGAPRYERPVIIDPAAFAAIPAPGLAGVSIKHLGTFTERSLRLDILSLAPGAAYPVSGPRLGYVYHGEGAIGDHAFAGGEGVRIASGESIVISASTASEFLLIGLPEPIARA
jgi:hypothetical protein